MVYNARQCAKQGVGLGAARLAKLQEGLAKLQAEGVLEGIKVTKVQHAQQQAQQAQQEQQQAQQQAQQAQQAQQQQQQAQ